MSYPQRYIGLMSGTSADAMDGALVCFDNHRLSVEAFVSIPYDMTFTHRLRTAAIAQQLEATGILGLEQEIAQRSAAVVRQLLKQQGLASSDITAIGSHGHTLRHQIQPFMATWQVGDPSLIAELTGICCVADFRRRDVAAGGQGAPLVPAFHARYLGSSVTPRMVLNIGGIANLTIIQGEQTLGFDSGPGNALMDEWCQQHMDLPCDANGDLARKGLVHQALVDTWLQADYFREPPPKSTGREQFRLSLLAGLDGLSDQDALATLTEFTACSIARAVGHWGHSAGEVLVCGGGIRNGWLMERLQKLLPAHLVISSAAAGIAPDCMEAVAFAWLARQTLLGLPGNQPSVTGAQGPRVLGGIYPA
jgi:anhydro-N-acetylmuramic acid kinase